MKNADNRQTYIHRFMQLPVEDRFAWTTRSCFDIAYIFDVGEKYEKAISIGQTWITSTEMPEFQRLCQQHMDTMRESLRSRVCHPVRGLALLAPRKGSAVCGIP